MNANYILDMFFYVIGYLVWVSLIGFMFYCIGYNDGKKYMQSEASEHDFGQYVADPKTGKIEWRWSKGK
jgi:hypothetical protein